METRWSRRALLTALGATALSGCSAAPDGSEATPTATRPPTTTPTPTPTPPASIDSSWPLPDRDPGRSNYAPIATGPTERVAPLWKRSADAPLTAPVVAQGRVYVGDGAGQVRAFDGRTGEQHWAQTVGEGARTPQVQNGRVVVPTSEGVRAVSTDGGAQLWRADTATLADVVATKGAVYYLTDDPETEQIEERPTLVSLDAEDGNERWRKRLGSPWAPRLFVGGGRVFVPSGPHDVRAWTFAADSGEFLLDEQPRRGADFPSSRFYHGGTRYMVEGFFGSIEAEPVTPDGAEWSAGLDQGGTIEISGGDERVYVAQKPYEDGSRLFALSASSGSFEWERSLPTAKQRPVVTAETVLVAVDGRLRCVDPATGSLRWALDDRRIGGSFVVVDDLVIATHDDTLLALRPP